MTDLLPPQPLDVFVLNGFLYELFATTDRASGEEKVVIHWATLDDSRRGVIGGFWASAEAAIAWLNRPVSIPVP